MGQYAFIVSTPLFRKIHLIHSHYCGVFSHLSWSMLKYPIPKDRRIALAKIYFYVGITPGMSAQIIATCADGFKILTQSKKKISIEDLRLPWKPIYNILSQDLFLSRRQFEYTYARSGCSMVHRVTYSQAQSVILVHGLHR